MIFILENLVGKTNSFTFCQLKFQGLTIAVHLSLPFKAAKNGILVGNGQRENFYLSNDDIISLTIAVWSLQVKYHYLLLKILTI